MALLAYPPLNRCSTGRMKGVSSQGREVPL